MLRTLAAKMGIVEYKTTCNANEQVSVKLRNFASLLFISDSSWGSSIALLKRGRHLEVLGINKDSSITLECSMDNDEFTLNILYSKQSNNLRILEL